VRGSTRMLWALVGSAIVLPLSAQTAGGPSGLASAPAVVSMSPTPQAPSSFGPGTAILSIESSAFTPVDSTTTWTWDMGSGARYRVGGAYPWFDASVHVPSGAKVIGVVFEVFDNDAANNVLGFFGTEAGAPPGTPWAFTAGSATAGQPGWTYIVEPLNITIDNFNNSYIVEVNVGGSSSATMFRRAMIYYQLQVSPAPGTATFGDVPTSDPAFQFIEAFVASGITAGCGSGNYCPDAPLTRRQMAVFFSKALGLFWAY
jgi:hypothetical protein